jgi:hypothetical protein
MILNGSSGWKEASLDELEHISKDSLGLMKKSVDN